MPTAICNSRLRSGSAHWDLNCEEEAAGEEAEETEEAEEAKSNNPHLAGGEKTQIQPPFDPSVDSLCHPCFTTTNLSYRFPISSTLRLAGLTSA